MYPLMIIISKILFIIPIFLGLLVFKTKITFFAMVMFVSLYVLIFQIFKKKMKFLGELQTRVTENKFSILNQGFGRIKEVKFLTDLNFLESIIIICIINSINTSRRHCWQISKVFNRTYIISASILLILYFSNNLQFNFNEIIINMSFFLIIAYKIIPALQQVYYNANIVKNHVPAISKLSYDLNNSKKKYKLVNKDNIIFNNFKSLEIKNLYFKYKTSKGEVLNKISFRISNGEKIAITGLSGSGKTTLINILLGIININRGKIIINNKVLKKTSYYPGRN